MNIIYDIDEITESKELLQKEPNQFLQLFIYLILAVIIAVLLWMYFGEIDVVVKAKTIVRPSSKISTITNALPEKVEAVYFGQGIEVGDGDTLYTLENESFVKEKALLEEQIKKSRNNLKTLKILKEFILDGTAIYELNKKNIQSSMKQLENEIIQTRINYDNMVTFKDSIEQKNNLFAPSNNEYFTKFLDYQYNYELLKTDLEKKERAYEKSKLLFEEKAISTESLNDVKESYIIAKLELQKYDNENFASIYTTIEECKKKLDQLLASIEKEVIAYEDNINELNHRKIIAKSNIEKSVVKAPISGVINVITEINRGDYLLTGVEILTIVPNDHKPFKCKIFVPNKDISKINIGDKIKYKFDALPYREYGTVKGEVFKMGTDITNTENGFYLIEALVDNKGIVNYKGVQAQLKAGMEGEALIITERKKIIKILLEKIDLSLN